MNVIVVFLIDYCYRGRKKYISKNMSRLRGYDPDGDSLAFGVTGAGSGLVRVEARDEYSADVFLRRDLDHEVSDVSREHYVIIV